MGEEQADSRVELRRLEKLAARRKFDELDAAWTRAVENELVAPAFLLSIPEKLAAAGEVEHAESLLWFLLTDRAERKGPDEALRVARSAVERFPQSPILREELASLYPAAHAGVPGIDALAQAILRTPDVELAAAVEQIEQFLAFRPGTYVLDTEHGQPGSVEEFDADAVALSVRFEDGPRTYDAASIGRLEPLDSGDFRALLVFDPARLRELAEKDPAELVTRTLRAFGPRMTFSTMKARLATVVPDKEWSKWWAAAKPRLQRAPWVELSDSSRPTFTLRKTPIAYENILKAHFNTAPSPEEKLGVVLGYLKEIDQGATPDGGVLAFFAAQLDRLVEAARENAPAVALGALAVATEMHRRLPDTVPAPAHDLESLLPDDALSDLMRPIRDDTLSRLILERIRDALPDRWQDVCRRVMAGASPAACEWIAREMTAAGQGADLRPAIADALARPDRNAGALAWIWRAVTAGDYPEVLAEVDPIAVAVQLFSAAASLGRGKARDLPTEQHLLPQVRAAIALKNYEPLRRVLAGADEDRARRIKNYIDRHIGLSDHSIRRVHEILIKTHRELFVEHVEPWEEDVVYTTEAGLRRRQAELSHLVTVRMAEASKAVGAAAALGDLSENAEWTAAKEERDRLAAQATRMQEEINKARILTPELARRETVTVGSRVKAKDLASGRVETFVFLGPWDADRSKGIYSYRAALGLAFMGKKPGDHVRFRADHDERTWEILEVESAL